MSRIEVLHELLKHGPLEPLHAQMICGWGPQEFEKIMAEAIAAGRVFRKTKCNQYKTQLDIQ